MMGEDATFALRAPLALWWALVVLPGLWLHLIRRRPALPVFDLDPLPAKEAPGLQDPAVLLPRGSFRTKFRLASHALVALGALALWIAAAEPVEQRVVTEPKEARELLIALDRSSSMAAMSGDATRFDILRDGALRFVSAREGDRIGVIAFARFPDVLCPPTDDHAALAELLRGVTPVRSDSPEDATGIGAAVARAARSLSSSIERERAVILFTDGVETVHDPRLPKEIAPLHAGQLCEELGLRVHVVLAFVQPGEPREERARREVRRIAERTGGLVFEARDEAEVRRVFETIDRLERSPFESYEVVIFPRHQPLLWLGALTLVLALMCRARAGRDWLR